MRKIFLLLITILILFVIDAGAAELRGSCRIHFYGDSTLHGFEGTAACDPFVFRSAFEGGDQLSFAGADVQVAVKGMNTDNGSRDSNMYDMFAADAYPFLVGHFKDFKVPELLQQVEKGGLMFFELTIRDQSNPVQAAVRDLKQEPGRLTFAAEFQISLKDYHLKAPSVLGIIRVADEVRVVVDVVLEGDALNLH